MGYKMGSQGESERVKRKALIRNGLACPIDRHKPLQEALKALDGCDEYVR